MAIKSYNFPATSVHKGSGFLIDSGVTTFLTPGASSNNGCHWQKLRTLKTSQLFIGFPLFVSQI